jgi:hypothetical protein
MASSTTRRRALRSVAPAAGLLLAGLLVWQGSNAAFTATTTSPGNTWTAGSVALENNAIDGVYRQVGQAAFSLTNIKPGDTLSRCITVRSQGTVPANGRFYVSSVSGVAGPGGGSLPTQIRLTVETGSSAPADCTGFTAASTVVNNVALPSVVSSYAAASNSWVLSGTAGETQTYRVTYVFDPAADNTFQGSSASATFNWEVQ